MLDSGKRIVARMRERPILRLLGSVGGLFLLLATLSSTGLASAAVPPVVYYACVNKATFEWNYANALTVCPAGYTKEHWNQTGPQGPQGKQGPQGVQGPPGPQGPSNGFHSFSDGVTLAGYVTVSTLSIPAGNYMIFFKGVPYNTIAADAMHCDLFDTLGNNIDQTYAELVLGSGYSFTDQSIGMISTTVTAGGTLSVACSDDAASAIMFRNDLSAIQLGSVTGLAANTTHHSNNRNRP